MMLSKVHRYIRPALLVSVLVVSGLLGCTDPATRNEIDMQADEANKNLANTLHQVPARHYNPLVVSDKVWGGDTALRMHRGTPMPPKYEGPHGITLVSNSPLSLTEIAGI